MVDFGIVEQWVPAAGRLVSWRASRESVTRAASAPVDPTPPSHQQEEYLRSVHRDIRRRGLCVATAEVPGTLDRTAMTRAINAFLFRHDTFRSWFTVGPGGEVVRHSVAPEDIEFVATDSGVRDGVAIRELVQQQTPGPDRWDCFTFGIVERACSTTVYLAIDHLHTDGVAQHISCFDLARLYALEVGGQPVGLPAAASYLEYCARQRGYSSGLSRASPGVVRWVELVRGNDGELPSFPLDLGRQPHRHHRGAHRTIRLFDASGAARFEQVCRDNGASFVGGVFAAAALTERDLVGSDYYFGMTPISARMSPSELVSVGWYATLVPVAFPVSRNAPFSRLAKSAQHAYESGCGLASVPFQRVMELVSAEDGVTVRRGWTTPMLSYVDARGFAGNELFDATAVAIYGGGEATDEVHLWINRLPAGTFASVIFPDTAVAHESVQRYLAVLQSILVEVAGQPDRTACHGHSAGVGTGP